MTNGFFKKKFSDYIINETLKYQKKHGFKLGNPGHETYNSEADAFKHAYMQWMLSNFFGTGLAKSAGDRHEKANPYNNFREKNMDLWNNAIGREVFKELVSEGKSSILFKDEAAKKIVDKMNAGELILSPDDLRMFENMELERLKPEDRIYFKGEFDKPISDDVIERYLEQAIDNDWLLPDRAALDDRVKSGELIYVDEYKKSDGTTISGYYRRKPRR